jgi:hypothetical protein
LTISTERNQHLSPLLKLPAELRNKIYDYLSSIETSQGNYIAIRTPNARALSRVCRQLHSGYAAFPYTFRSPSLYYGLSKDRSTESFAFGEAICPLIRALRYELPSTRAWRHTPNHTPHDCSMFMAEIHTLQTLATLPNLTILHLIMRAAKYGMGRLQPTSYSEEEMTKDIQTWKGKARGEVCDRTNIEDVSFEYIWE